MKILIRTTGFIGDILFASAIAESFYSKYGGNAMVDYLIGFPQPYELLTLNPFISDVFLSDNYGPYVSNKIVDSVKYDAVYTLPHVNQNEIPVIQFKKACGIEIPKFDYKVYTNKAIDRVVGDKLLKLKESTGKKIIGVVANWKQSTVKYTIDEYMSGIQFPNVLAHAHSNTRDIDYIINKLKEKYILIPLGFDHQVSQYDIGLESCSLYSYTASVIKFCDLVIGQEGGMTNLAAGIGTKTMITTDFMNYLYGKYGRMKQYDEIKLGPANICPNGNHIHLAPYVSDEEIVKSIYEAL